MIDFGNAKISNGKTRTICGTAYYMAPEMAAGKRYGRAADWWSVGIVLYEMLHGLNAFEIKVTSYLTQGSDNVAKRTLEKMRQKFMKLSTRIRYHSMAT